MSLSRKFACFILFALTATLALILVRAVSDQPHIKERIENHQTFHVFADTHIHGSEIEMTYLDSGKDELQNCESRCLDQSACIAVNYYPAKESSKAQCWLFQKIEADKIEPQMPCCTLAVKSLYFKDIALLNKAVNKK